MTCVTKESLSVYLLMTFYQELSNQKAAQVHLSPLKVYIRFYHVIILPRNHLQMG